MGSFDAGRNESAPRRHRSTPNAQFLSPVIRHTSPIARHPSPPATIPIQTRITRRQDNENQRGQGCGFEDLAVWRRASRLSVALYRALDDARAYGFKGQVTRSALSIPSNIAEGYERYAPRSPEVPALCPGSCGELRTQLYIGIEAGYLPCESGAEWVQETRALSAMLLQLIRAWESRS